MESACFGLTWTGVVSSEILSFCVLDCLIRAVPSSEKFFIGGDLNGHVGTTSAGFEAVHGGFGYGSRNQEGGKF